MLGNKICAASSAVFVHLSGSGFVSVEVVDNWVSTGQLRAPLLGDQQKATHSWEERNTTRVKTKRDHVNRLLTKLSWLRPCSVMLTLWLWRQLKSGTMNKKNELVPDPTGQGRYKDEGGSGFNSSGQKRLKQNHRDLKSLDQIKSYWFSRLYCVVVLI